jgi:Protein of unknown function (DUF1761)
MIEINYTLVAITVIVQFIIGGFWYSPLMFGKIWDKIMHKENLSKEQIAKIQKGMLPFYFLQLGFTIVYTILLAYILKISQNLNLNTYIVSFSIWFGFLLSTQVSTVIWGNTKKEVWFKQISILAASQLLLIMIATFILSM